MATKVSDLMDQVQAAYDAVVEASAARDTAAMVLDEKAKKHKASTDALVALQKQLQDVLGSVLPAGDARFRVSA